MTDRPHYNPNQPRVPKGRHDSGQWTAGHSRQPVAGHEDEPWSAGSDDQRSSAEHDGDPWTVDQDHERVAPQPAFLGPLGRAVVRGGASRLGPQLSARQALVNGLATFSALSLLNTDDRRAIAEFKVGEFSRDPDKLLTFERVRMLDEDELKKICEHVDKVQKMADEASEDTYKYQPDLTPPVHGTAVHTRVKKAVDAFGDPDLTGELRIKYLEGDQTTKDPTGRRPKLWVVLDIFELKREKKIACVYDVKTQNAVLDEDRMTEIAEYLLKQDQRVDRLFLVQVKPKPPKPR